MKFKYCVLGGFFVLPGYYFEGVFKKYEKLIKQLNCRPVVYQPKESIFPAGQYFDKGIYIQSGMVRDTIINTKGRESNVMHFQGPGMVIPCYCKPYQTSLEPLLSVDAFTTVRALSFDIHEFGDLVIQTPELAQTVIEMQLRLQNSALVRIQQTSSYNSLQQVCNTLYIMKIINGTTDLMMTQEEVGAFNGLSRVQVTRVLKQLREEGIVSTQRGRIIVKDPERLYEYCTAIVKEDKESIW